jgi:hypothetical protein
MYYGDARQLQDDDILVLAGDAAFEFERIRYHPFQFWEPRPEETRPRAWGIVIDGLKKRLVT